MPSASVTIERRAQPRPAVGAAVALPSISRKAIAPARCADVRVALGSKDNRALDQLVPRAVERARVTSSLLGEPAPTRTTERTSPSARCSLFRLGAEVAQEAGDLDRGQHDRHGRIQPRVGARRAWRPENVEDLATPTRSTQCRQPRRRVVSLAREGSGVVGSAARPASAPRSGERKNGAPSLATTFQTPSSLLAKSGVHDARVKAAGAQLRRAPEGHRRWLRSGGVVGSCSLGVA